MSSYTDYFCKSLENNMHSSDTESIKGTCTSMCPQEEVRVRQKETLVHVLEVKDSVKQLVKSYSRSAADSNMAVPRLLRPYSVLEDTVQYLLLDVTKRKDVSATVVYDFVTDRLRAVRQDMTIQRLPPQECINLLEPMARFHVFYGNILCNLPINDYDPVLNKKYLLECIKWFLSCCDNIDQSQKADQIDKSNEHKSFKLKKLACDRVLIESLYILCNLDDVHPLLRYLHLPKYLKIDPRLRLAFKIGLAHLKGNYMQVCKLLHRLCPLSYCALRTYLPVLQRRALLVISNAYNSKRLAVPSSAVRQWLNFSSDEEASTACAHYGLQVEGALVRFDKTEFRSDALLHQANPQELENLDFSLENIFTYKTCKE